MKKILLIALTTISLSCMGQGDTINFKQSVLIKDFETHLVLEIVLLKNYLLDCKDDSVLIGNTLVYTNDTLGFMDVYAPAIPDIEGYLKWLEKLHLNL